MITEFKRVMDKLFNDKEFKTKLVVSTFIDYVMKKENLPEDKAVDFIASLGMSFLKAKIEKGWLPEEMAQKLHDAIFAAEHKPMN